jgi:hypothetical protein
MNPEAVVQEELTAMNCEKGRHSRFLPVWLFLLALCGQPVWAQTPRTTIDMPQGGRIVYGKVPGADSQDTAMTAQLREMHQNCVKKPQVGKVFKMRGTDWVGLFFTVVNHPAGNVPVAGLIIVAATGPHSAEAANEAQHRSFDATQEEHDRRAQGFSNYLLDQTVIRDVQDPNTHATVWNRAAEAWQKAYPDRIEEVPTSQYIKGEDF